MIEKHGALGEKSEEILKCLTPWPLLLSISFNDPPFKKRSCICHERLREYLLSFFFRKEPTEKEVKSCFWLTKISLKPQDSAYFQDHSGSSVLKTCDFEEQNIVTL